MEIEEAPAQQTQPSHTNVHPHNDGISADAINKIKQDLVEKNYYRDIQYNINSKFRWKWAGDFTEALAHLCTALSVILAFSAGFFNYSLLSFIAGCFGTCSFVLLRLSSYSMKESRERTEQVNALLRKIGIDSIPDIVIDSALTNSNMNNV